MHKYILMGAQGSGKGTQAKRLQERFDLVQISVGDIFRWNIQNHTKLGARVRRHVASGELVPDEVVEEVVRARLEQHDWNYGFLLDGFPRSRAQAEFLLESYNVDAVILIEIPDALVYDRVLARRLCARCGLDYNLIQHRPKVAGVCDVCGGALVAREDDRPEAVRERLEDYHQKTEPVIELFRQRGLLVTVDGTKPPDEVEEEICHAIGLPPPDREALAANGA